MGVDKCSRSVLYGAVALRRQRPDRAAEARASRMTAELTKQIQAAKGDVERLTGERDALSCKIADTTITSAVRDAAREARVLPKHKT